MRSPETKTSGPWLVSRPGDVWTSVLCFVNIELEWRAQCKPPNVAVSARQHLYIVVRIILARSATRHPPKAKTGLYLSSNLIYLAGSCRPPNGSSSHNLMVVAQSLSKLKETSQIECEMCSRSHIRYKELGWRVPKLLNWTVLRWLLNEVVSKLEFRRGNWMSCSHSRLAEAHPFLPIFCRPCTAPRIVGMPSAGSTERCNEWSNVGKGLTVRQALTSSSTRVEEGQRVAVMLSVSAPAMLFVPPASNVRPQCPPDGQMSPVLSVQHAAPMLLRLSESVSFLQTALSSQLSSRLSGLSPKFTNDEGYKLRPFKVVSFSKPSSAEWLSLEVTASAQRPLAVLKLGAAQVARPCLQSLEGWWQARRKPPNVVTKPKQRNSSIVDKAIGLNATKPMPSNKAASALSASQYIRPLQKLAHAIQVLSSSCCLLSCMMGRLYNSLKLLQLVRTPALCIPDTSDRHVYFP